jgi:hypothetical protein
LVGVICRWSADKINLQNLQKGKEEMKFVRTAMAVSVCSLAMTVGVNNIQAAQSPDQVVMQLSKAIQNNRPEVVFQALPASYQKSIQGLVADAAKRMDTEVWNAGQELLKTAVNVAKKQKNLLLQSQMLASNPNKDKIAKDWDNSIKMISTLIKSDFTDIKKLREADIEKMLATSGATIMKEATSLRSAGELQENINKLKSVKATLVSKTGNTAKVKITSDGEEPEVVDFVKIEGKWIPKEMADGFTESIKEAHEGLKKMDFTTPEGKKAKEMILKQISVAKNMLTKAGDAKSKEELDGILMGMMMSIMMSMQPQSGGPAGAPPASM